MSNVVHSRTRSPSNFQRRATLRRIVAAAGTYVIIGAMIGSLNARISQPGILAWTLVLGIFGGLIGLLGGRPRDIMLASTCLVGFGLFTSAITRSGDTSFADSIASGLLLGAIAGGLFRPWCRISIGSLSIARHIFRRIVRGHHEQPTLPPGAATHAPLTMPVEPDEEFLRKAS